MPWVQVTLYTNPAHVPMLEEWLFACNAGAVTLQDAANQPVFEPEKGTTPLWQQTLIMGLFDAATNAEVLFKQLREQWQQTLPELDFPQHKLEILEDKDWEREWMQRFEPIQFSDNFWVCPSWKPVPNPEAANLMLDPGLAFGTGSHPTTALCLQWLALQTLSQKQVIDYGCGSGILALAALLLGAEQALCIDNDEQALIATHDNAQRNHIDLQRIPTYLPEHVPTCTADVVIANILADPLIGLAPTLAKLSKPKGMLALSGILNQQSDAVIAAYTPWFDITHVETSAEWVRIDGIRKAEC